MRSVLPVTALLLLGGVAHAETDLDRALPVLDGPVTAEHLKVGSADAVVPPDQARRFAEAAKPARGQVELLEVKGQPHIWQGLREWTDRVVSWIEARANAGGK